MLKPCPFCGKDVFVEKQPMWHTYDDGTTHGYRGMYKFVIECTNPECRCSVNLGGNSTYRNTEAEALQEAIDHWNKRA